MNKLDNDYQSLLQDILDNGITRNDRTGTGSLSVFVRTIRHKMSDGFPLLTTKQMPFKVIVTELLWFLKGDTNIRYLLENKCDIWTGDAYKNYVQKVGFSSNPYDRHIIENKPSDIAPGWGEFKIGEHFTKKEFVDKILTDDDFAKRWGNMGPIYGKQWRNWKGFKHGWHDVAKTIDGIEPHRSYLEGIDQISKLINDLKTNPDSRRLIVNAWNVAEIEDMVLPPCHFGFECYTRELSIDERLLIKENQRPGENPGYELGRSDDYYESFCDNWYIPKRALSLKFNIRSNDVPLGLPFNIASYGILLLLLAKQVNMYPDELVYVGTDVHIYLNQIEGCKEQIQRESYPLPTVKISDRIVNDISDYTLEDIILENYKCQPKIYFPLSN